MTKLTSIVKNVFDQWMLKHEKSYREEFLINMSCLTDTCYFKSDLELRVEFFEWISQKKLRGVVQDILNESVYFHDTQLFFNPFEKGKKPYWHRDFQYSGLSDEVLRNELGKLKCLHLRIPLITEKGVELIPQSHLRWDKEIERDVRLELNGHKNSESLPHSKLISLEKGDLLIFDAQMLHKGNYELNESRMTFDICVGVEHEIVNSSLNKIAQPSEDELMKLMNKEWYLNTKKMISQ